MFNSLKKILLPINTFKAIHIIIFLGILVFANMLFNNFVWDDKAFILNNLEIQTFNIDAIFKAGNLNNINAGRYLPLTTFYFMLLYNLFNDVTFFYHLIQLTLHIINVLLIFYMFIRFFNKTISLFLSLIFLIHPVQVESVSYIASVNNPLFMLFGLIALIISLKENISVRLIFLTSLFVFLSLLIKETGILFFIIILLFRFLFYKKINIFYVIFFSVGILIYFYFRFFIAGVFSSKITLAPITRLDFWDRIANSPSIILYYLKTFLFPFNLAIEQMWIVGKNYVLEVFFPLFIIFLIFIPLIFFGKLIYKNSKKHFLIFIFFNIWFAMGISLHLNIFPLSMTVADRWFYFPFLGLLGVFGVIMEYFQKEIRKHANLFLFLAFMIIVLLSIRTVLRNTNWKDAITLYSNDLKIEKNFDLENNLGGELNIAGKSSEAYIHFKNSVNLFPHETNLFNLAMSYKNKGDIKKAIYYLELAYSSKSYGEVIHPFRHSQYLYEQLGQLLIDVNTSKAVKILEEGLDQYSQDPSLLYFAALANYKLGNKDNALNYSQKAYKILPNNIHTKKLYDALINNKSISTY